MHKLEEQNIKYHSEENQVNNDYRFYFREKDREIVDSLMKKNGITSNVEGYPITNARFNVKSIKFAIYLIVIFLSLASLFIILSKA